MAENGLQARTGPQPVIYGADREIAHYVSKGLGEEFSIYSRAIGFTLDGKIVGGVVYHNYRGTGIEGSIYTTDKRWCNRHNLYHIFHYPFEQLGCKRFTAITQTRNQSSQTFLEKLGFKQEGLIRQAFEDDDGILYGMLREECRWVNHPKRQKRQILT